MTISDYQVSSVIRTYMKHMKMKLKPRENPSSRKIGEDQVVISEEAMKEILLERVKERMNEVVNTNEPKG